jgi:hypothetical protein
MVTSKLAYVLFCLMFFLIGFLSAEIVNSGYVLNGSSAAPSDFIAEDSISVFDDRIVIQLDGASLSRYAPTGSMKPLFDEGANGIRIKPKEERDVSVGDIVSFNRDGDLIVHRVVEKGLDLEGVYFITKGDNVTLSDGKVRFEDIEWVTVGLLY